MQDLVEAKFSIGNAKQDGMYNVVSTCAYGNTVDPIKIKDEWNGLEFELSYYLISGEGEACLTISK